MNLFDLDEPDNGFSDVAEYYELIETPRALAQRMRVDALAADLASVLAAPSAVVPTERDTVPALPAARSTLRCAQ